MRLAVRSLTNTSSWRCAWSRGTNLPLPESWKLSNVTDQFRSVYNTEIYFLKSHSHINPQFFILISCSLFIIIPYLLYEGVSKSFRTASIKKYTLTFGIAHCCPLQRVTAAKLTTLTHKIAIHLHSVTESCTICSSRSGRPVRKLLVHLID
jgi:hypothetical protein